MPFPSTPLTLLGRLKHGDTHIWETSWEEFFDLYHHAVNVCVLGAFTRYKWHDVPHQDLQDVAISGFESIFKGHETFDPSKGRFRSLLTTLCQRRVVDFIRAHMRRAAKTTPIDSKILEKMESDGADAKNSSAEEEAFRNALLGTLLSALRSEVSPRTVRIFEDVKLNGKSPEEVAEELGVQRNVIDNTIFKAMKKLRKISKREEIRQEL